MELKEKIRRKGEHHPKKHGDWFRIHAYDNNWLVYDTWNGSVYHYSNGCSPGDANNLYHVVYVFYDKDGIVDNCKRVKPHMYGFWNGHLH